MKYARIAIHDLRPGSVDAAIRHAEAELLPLFRGQPDFVSYTVYRAGLHSLGSVSVWQSREAAEQAVRLAEDWIEGNLPNTIVASRIIVGELAFESEGPSLTAGLASAEPPH